jgi:hypothetical protein
MVGSKVLLKHDQCNCSGQFTGKSVTLSYYVCTAVMYQGIGLLTGSVDCETFLEMFQNKNVEKDIAYFA